jgi:hypothetical protein
MSTVEERALDYVERNGLIYSKQHPTDQQALEQEQAEKSLAQRITIFAKSEFPREREEAVRQFIEKVRAKTMEHFENDIWTSADAEVFKEMFGKEL